MAFVPVTYSNGDPVLSSTGASRVACSHLAAWLKVYDELQVFRNRGHVVYYQTMGGADASAGTHLCGSAWDMKYISDAAVMDAREMGAAVWPRLVKYGWTTGEHVHGLISCGDNSCNVYQYNAYLAGYNGLGTGGRASRDPLPKPSAIRGWQDGIVWAKGQMKQSTPLLTSLEDDMPIFMRTTDTTIWLLRPGAPPHGLSMQEWVLWARLGATTPGGDFNRLEVDIVNSLLQPGAAAPVAIDMVAITAAIKSAVQEIDAVSDADADLIASKVRAKIIKD